MTTVRTFSPGDTPGIYRVCRMTGDSGGDASPLHGNPDLPGHVHAGPYTFHDPRLNVVLCDEQGVAGYLVGTVNTLKLRGWAERVWWPTLREQYPLESDHYTEADAALVRLIHQPDPVDEALLEEFPAHLHVNLLPRLRGQGWGSKVIAEFLEMLWQRGVPGVHLEVAHANEQAQGFYRHIGFREHSQTPRGVVMTFPLV